MNANTQSTALKKSLAKEYLVGLSVLVFAVVIALWLIQKDWSSMLSKSMVPENTHFIAAGSFNVAVTIQPETPQVGNNQILIQVRDQQGNPIQGAKVRAVGEMPAMGSMPAMYAQATIAEIAPGNYQGEFELPMAGAWPLAVDIATDEAHHVDLAFDMTTSRKGLSLVTASPVGDVAYHTCSMHPSVKSAAPGTCPICGMDLVPVSQEELQSGSIMVEEGRRQTIGIKTGKVIKENFSFPIRLSGEVTYDQSRLTDISLRFNGWIGELNANFEGKTIKQGDILFTVYSPQLLSLQEEHLGTLKRSQGRNQPNALLNASRKRLKLWGLNATQISRLEQKGKAQDYLPIFAPTNGVVINKGIVSGSAFNQGERLLRIADLSQVWVEAFAYEQDLPLITPGIMAVIQLPSDPEKEFTAKVMQIDPFLGTNTRTTRVRFQVNNASGKLKPGVFAKVILQIKLGRKLLVPVDAVLVSGEKRIVFLDLGNGRLKPQAIKTGYSDGEMVVVLDGLSQGDAIITSGNFLIAAESKLKLGIDQW